jgi:cysteine desulfurase/selenocysteine lyase
MDVERIRADFPILQKGVIYLDNSATSLTPVQVLDAMQDYYLNYRANVHRGLHRLSLAASERYEQAHERVAGFIGAGKSEISFVKNATEAINLVALSIDWERGDRIVTTALEHHSNLLPWLRCAKKHGVEVSIVRPNKQGELSAADFEAACEGARLVAVTHVSNVMGAVSPAKEIGRIAKKNGALFLLDGAQSVPHMQTNVRELGCDFLAFSAHKMLGPTGMGALYMRRELAETLEPAILGGGTITDVSENAYSLIAPYERWEAGTPNVAGAIGFAAAIEYLQKTGMRSIEQHEQALAKYALEQLQKIDGVTVYGPAHRQAGIIPFNVRNMNPHDVSSMLDESAGIATRSGHHCAMPLSKMLGLPNGTVRASFYLYNTEAEIDKLAATLREIAKIA